MRQPHQRMSTRTFNRTVIISLVLDAFIIFAAYAISFSVKFGFSTIAHYTMALNFIVFAAVTMLVLLYMYGVYFRIWSQTSSHGLDILIKAAVVGTIITMVVDGIIRPRPIPLSVVLVSGALAVNGFVLVRYRSRVIAGLGWRWKAIWHEEFPAGDTKTRVLIAGAGEAGQTLAWRLQHRFPDNSYQIVGFVDDDKSRQGMYVEECLVLGKCADIPNLVEKHNIDLIVVAIHNISGPDFRRIVEYCESTKARIKIVPNVLALMNATHSSVLLRDVQPEDLLGRKLVTQHEAVNLGPVTGKTILVTGAAGSIGSELCRQLCSLKPDKLIMVDVNESGLHDLMIELKTQSPSVNLVTTLVDITMRDTLEWVFAEHHPEVVFHAAAYKHVPMLEMFPDQAVKVNIGGTRNVAELARDYHAQRFVLISTDKAVNPSSVMGASKRICEMLVQTIGRQSNHNTLFTSVRFGNVLGSRGSVVPIFTRQINVGGPITVTHPEMTRYFMTIPEAVNLVIHAACLTKGNEIFLLKMGEVVRIVELAERMIRLRGMRPYIDIEIQFTGMRPGEKMHEQLYDGSAEDAVETIHPGIIQLNSDPGRYDAQELMEWIDHLIIYGIHKEKALEELLWGLTPNEEFAVATA